MGYLYQLLMLLTTVLATSMIWLLLYYRKQFQHWKKKKIFYLQPSFPFGNLGLANFTKNTSEVFHEIYQQTKHERFVGIWNMCEPVIIINDLDLIKQVTIKDFQHFHSRAGYFNPENDPLSEHIVMLNGDKWRNMRVKLTPAFTSGKLKMMHPFMLKCQKNLVDQLQTAAERREMVDLKPFLDSAAIEVIASCAYGIEVNAYDDPDCVFKRMGEEFFDPSFLDSFRQFLLFNAPKIGKLFNARMTPRSIESYFIQIVETTINNRLKSNIERNDFLQLMINLIHRGYIEAADKETPPVSDLQKFTLTQAAANLFLFFLGGYETTTVTLQNLLYELALNPNIQHKLCEEIDENVNRNKGELTYETIQSMSYLDCVLSETLRKNPVAGFTARICTKDYTIPDTDVVIEEGTLVNIPIIGVHHDERYYPQPHIFDPGRFTPEEKGKRHRCAYLPFGEGLRNCIGDRFALIQVKTAVALLLRHYKFEVCEKTPIPLHCQIRCLIIKPKDKVYLRISTRRRH